MDTDEEDEKEEQKEKEVKPKKSEKKSVKKNETNDDDEDKKEKEVKPKKSEKKSVKKKLDSDDDSDDNSEDKPKKGEKKSEKKPAIKESMEDSDSDSESQKKSKKKEKQEKKEKKEESDNEKEKEKEEESEEEIGAKQTAKKEEVSEEEENEEKEKENKNEKEEDEEELPANAYEELFVRNIGYNTTQEELAEFFAKYGDVEESKIVTDKQTGKSRGFGFLKFYEKKSAVAAMKDADNIVVGGRNLQIRYSNDKNSQIKGGNGNSAKKGPATEFGVFVGNISYKCTENDLKKFFKDCGKIVEVRIAKRDDGKLKGFAHVDFETKEAMEKAVEKNGKELQGRPLKIDQSTRGGNARGGNRGGQGRGRGNNNNADPMAKAKRTGGIIAPTENKVTTYDDSDDDE